MGCGDDETPLHLIPASSKDFAEFYRRLAPAMPRLTDSDGFGGGRNREHFVPFLRFLLTLPVETAEIEKSIFRNPLKIPILR